MRPPISPLPFLTQIPDWRAPTRIQYPWDALWTVILTGLLAGPPNILALTQWLAGHREVLCQHLGLDRLPQQAMIYRFFWSLDQHLPELQRALLDWVKAQHPTAHDRLVILAGDGKVLKGSAREGRTALSFLSVFFHELALTVAQVDQAGRHEAKGMQDLLPTLTTLFGNGWLVTLDAAYTERELTTRIDEAGGAYLVPLKNNTRSLKEWAKFAFTYPAHDHVVDVERRSGEIWERRTSVITGAQVPDDIKEGLCGVQTLIRREHQVTRRDGTQRVEVRYAVSSRLLTAQEAERIWRGHWGIENRSHHCRDVVLHEDACRLRKGAQGRAMLNGVIVALLSGQTRQITALVRRLTIDPLLALQLLIPDLASR